MIRRLVLVAAAALSAAAAAATPSRAAGVATSSVVAQAAGRTVAVYSSPTATRPFRTFTRVTRNGAPQVFLVKHREAGWEQVYLPVRPNGSTGWVRDADVQLSVDPYEVVVSRAAHQVSIYENGRLVRRIRAAVGRAALPTPAGTYYLSELLKQPDPSGMLGPYVFTLSAFSNVLYSFGGGPGQIGLHGTNEPSLLGRDVSHGCIRISDNDITVLAHLLPLGTPVVIR